MNNNQFNQYNNGQQQPYGQQPYGQQPYGQQPFGQSPFGSPNPNDGKAFSIAALVLGVCSAGLSLIFAWWTFPISIIFLVCGVAGIVLGVLGRQKSTACYGRPNGLATAGFVLSIIGTAISALFVLSCLACYACASAELAALDSLYYDLY